MVFQTDGQRGRRSAVAPIPNFWMSLCEIPMGRHSTSRRPFLFSNMKTFYAIYVCPHVNYAPVLFIQPSAVLQFITIPQHFQCKQYDSVVCILLACWAVQQWSNCLVQNFCLLLSCMLGFFVILCGVPWWCISLHHHLTARRSQVFMLRYHVLPQSAWALTASPTQAGDGGTTLKLLCLMSRVYPDFLLCRNREDID